MKQLFLLILVGLKYSAPLYSQSLSNSSPIDTLLANQVTEQYCQELTQLRSQLNEPEDVVGATIEIDNRLFFQSKTNRTFRQLIQKMNLRNPQTTPNVETAIRYVLTKMIRECPTYAYGWGQRTPMRKASGVLGQQYCNCVGEKTSPSTRPDKDAFYQKVGITTTCGSSLANDSIYVKAVAAEIGLSESERIALGRNGFASLMTTCDEMVNSFVNMTLFFVKSPMDTWERDNLAPLPPPPPPPPSKKRK